MSNHSWSLKVQKCDANESALVHQKDFNGPKLDNKNVVSILISSDFLKIDRLVKECMEYFVENIDELAKVQVDMSCINSTIIRDMAK
jgi:hypothetical protein